MKKLYLLVVVIATTIFLVGCSSWKVDNKSSVVDVLESIEFSEKLPTIKIENDLDSVYDFKIYDDGDVLFHEKGSHKSSVSYQSNRSSDANDLVTISKMNFKSKIFYGEGDQEVVHPTNTNLKFYYNKGKSKYYHKNSYNGNKSQTTKGVIEDADVYEQAKLINYEQVLIKNLISSFNVSPDSFTLSSKGKNIKISFERLSDIGEESIFHLLHSLTAVMSRGGLYDYLNAKESFKFIMEINNNKIKKVSIDFNAYQNKSNEYKFKQEVYLGSKLGSKPIITGKEKVEHYHYRTSIDSFIYFLRSN